MLNWHQAIPPIQVAAGHYILFKNQNAENILFCLEQAVKFFGVAMGSQFTTKMQDAMERLFYTMWIDTARKKCAELDAIYRTFSTHEFEQLTRFCDFIMEDLDRHSLAYFN